MEDALPKDELSRFDELLFLVNEAPQSLRKEGDIESLFPAHDGSLHYEDFVSATFLEMYSYYRSLGMSRADSAHRIGASAKLIKELFTGAGITEDTFVKLVLAEVDAIAEFKEKNLKVLQDAAQSGKWQASVAALEMICPKEFGARIEDTDDAPPLLIVAYTDPTYKDVELPDEPEKV